MTISATSAFVNVFSPASAAVARQAPPTGSPTDVGAKEIGASGSAPFNHRHLIDGLKDKLRAQVLKEKDMDVSTLNAMPSETRAAVEADISHAVDTKLQASMERLVQTAAVNGKTEGALLNIRA